MSLFTQNNMHIKKSKTFELILFAMLGAIMFCSKILMEAIPNVHFLGMLTMVYTIVFRHKALIPIYVYVLLTGIYAGFSLWWIPHLYLWMLLWAVTMLLPENMSKKFALVVYPLICALHGLLYGTLYAPAQAIMYGMNFQKMIAWIVVGLPWDALHACGNFVAGLLIYPISQLLHKLMKKY